MRTFKWPPWGDEYKFGPSYILTKDGFVRETRWMRFKERVEAIVDAYILCRSHIQRVGADPETGVITMSLVRWSWRRLKWVRS